MRGKSWDLKRRYKASLSSGASDADRLREKVLRKTGWDYGKTLDQLLNWPLSGGTNPSIGLGAESFIRSTEALHIDSDSIWQVAASGEPRFHPLYGLYVEPTTDNECTNYNANPDVALSNVSVTAGTITRQADAAAITAAGLGVVCSDGNVFEHANSTGGPTTITVTSNVSAGAASISGFFKVTGGSVTLQLTGGLGTTAISTADYSRSVSDGITAVGAEEWQLVVPDGVTVRWILNQAENIDVSTTPIITTGAIKRRNIDALSLPISGNFNQTQGTIYIEWTPLFVHSDLASTIAVLAADPSTGGDSRFLYMTAVDEETRGYEGTTEVVAGVTIVSGTEVKHILRWSTSLNEMQCIADGSAGVAAGYDGAFGVGVNLIVGGASPLPHFVKNILIYGVDKGTAWAEDKTA